MKRNDQLNGVSAAHQIGYEPTDHCRQSDLSTSVLSVVIPFTTPELTRAALGHAVDCNDLDLDVSIVDVQVIPFPCPLNQPLINKDYSKRRLHELFKESGLQVRAAVLYARDWAEGFRRVLEPGSLVIVATNKRWWPAREKKLARTLSRAGYQVMLLPVVR